MGGEGWAGGPEAVALRSDLPTRHHGHDLLLSRAVADPVPYSALLQTPP